MTLLILSIFFHPFRKCTVSASITLRPPPQIRLIQSKCSQLRKYISYIRKLCFQVAPA